MDIFACIVATRPGCFFTLAGNEYEGLVWLDDSPKPTEEELLAAWPQVQHEQQYAAVEQARRARYQAETDGMYFAAMREDSPNLADWTAAVNQIKADLPYPQGPS